MAKKQACVFEIAGMRKRIAIIMGGVLPVPATKGGAVENLVQIILDENERTHNFDFLIFSVDEKRAREKSLNYRFSKFIFIPVEKKLHVFFLRALFFIINKISSSYKGSWFCLQIAKFLKKEHADLVILENAYMYAIPLKKKFPRLKIVTHLHNRWVFSGSFLERDVMNATDVFWGVSEYICQEIRTAAGGAKKRIVRLYNGIDTDRFSKKISISRRNEIKMNLGIAPDTFCFIFSGQIIPSKGIIELIEAFRVVEREISNVKLIFIGDSTNCPATITAALRATKNIICSGYIPYEQIQEYLQIGDIAVLPSIAPEALSLSVLEVLCVGLPTITTTSGGIPEATGGDCAKLVPLNMEKVSDQLAKSMIELYRNEEMRTLLSRKGSQRALYFSQKRFFLNFVKLCARECDT